MLLLATATTQPFRLNGLYIAQSVNSETRKAIPDASASFCASSSIPDKRAPDIIAETTHNLPPRSWSKSLNVNASPAK